MRTMPLCLSLVAILTLSACSSSRNPQAEAAAVAAATDWLSLLDSEDYAATWDTAAEFFKDSVQKEEWTQTIQSLRKPLGKNTSRELRSALYQTALPGAPEGEYVVIEFEAAFEHKESVIETVTPMLDNDGQWRVSGYYMK